MTKRFIPIALVLAMAGAAPQPSAHADLIKQGAVYHRDILVTDSAGANVTGLTSGAFTVKQSKAGAAPATVTPTITEKSLGHYDLAYTTGMSNTLGSSALAITASGAIQSDINDQVVAFDPGDAASLGLSNIANAAADTGNILDKLGSPAADVSTDISNIANNVWTRSVRTITGGGGSGSDPWAISLPGGYGPGTAGYRIGNYLTGDAFARLGSPAGASLAADIAAIMAKFPARSNQLAIDTSGRVTTANPATTVTIGH